MSELRELDEQKERVETGPTQFGNDWPGVFIRGDNAAYYAHCLDAVLNHGHTGIYLAVAKGLIGLLQGCDVRNLPPATSNCGDTKETDGARNIIKNDADEGEAARKE